MSKVIKLLIALLLTQGCANRGYNTLSLEVPELFPGFDPNKYIIQETPNNLMYIQKHLSSEFKDTNEFVEKDYSLKMNSSKYIYYVPLSRQPSSFLDIKKYNLWPTIRLQHRDALLIK